MKNYINITKKLIFQPLYLSVQWDLRCKVKTSQHVPPPRVVTALKSLANKLSIVAEITDPHPCLTLQCAIPRN